MLGNISRNLVLTTMKLLAFLVFTETVLSQVLNLDKFHQHDYRLILERTYISHYDKTYMNYAKVVPFKCNRTTVAVNATLNFKVNVGNDLMILTQFYKFASNEYRLFPLRFQEKFCHFVKANVFGSQRFLKCGTFAGCPLVSNTNITICNYIPDDTMLPPFIPSGSYQVKLHGLHANIELYVLEVFVKITRPEIK